MPAPPVQLTLKQASKNSDILLSSEERDQVACELADEMSLTWADEPEPPRAPFSLRPGRYQLALESALLVFLGAVGAGMAAEIGKDTWTLVKRVTARVFSRQSSKAYSLSARAYFILEVDDDRVAILTPIPRAPMGSPEKHFADAVDGQLEAMAGSWDALVDAVQALRREPREPGNVYRAVLVQGRWQVNLWPSLEELD